MCSGQNYLCGGALFISGDVFMHHFLGSIKAIFSIFVVLAFCSMGNKN